MLAAKYFYLQYSSAVLTGREKIAVEFEVPFVDKVVSSGIAVVVITVVFMFVSFT